MFQVGFQLEGIQAVIFNGIAGPHHLAVFQPGDGLHKGHLDLCRQGRTHTLDIDFVGPEPLRFQEQLVPVLVGEPDDLGFDAGAVPGPHPFDHAVEHAAPVQVVPDDLMGPGIGVGQVAGHLIPGGDGAHEGEIPHPFIPVLGFHFGVVQGPGIHPGRSPGLEPHELETGFLEGPGELHGGPLADGAGHVGHFPVEDLPPQVRAGAEDHRVGFEHFPGFRFHPLDLAILDQQLVDHQLFHVQVVLVFHHFFHDGVIQGFVCLGPESLYRIALAGVQHPHLDAGFIGCQSHLSSQGVDFPDQMAFGWSPHGRIAGHQGNIVHGQGGQQGLLPHPCRCQSRFASGMAGSHHYHIIMIHYDHAFPLRCYLPTQNWAKISSMISSGTSSPVISPRSWRAWVRSMVRQS